MNQATTTDPYGDTHHGQAARRRWSALCVVASLAAACDGGPDLLGVPLHDVSDADAAASDDADGEALADDAGDDALAPDADEGRDAGGADTDGAAPPQDRAPAPPDVPRCGAAAAACGASSDCCAGLSCVRGVCGRCDPAGARPLYCEEAGGGCWGPDVVCATARDCGGTLRACHSPLLTVNCATMRCECPASRPTYCAAAGALPEGCWPAGVDCATRVSCPRGTVACPAGQRADCATGACETPAQWFAGVYYSRTGRTENNIPFTSDNRSVTFRAGGTYSHSLGRAAPTTGAYTASGTQITCTSGALAGTSFGLNTSFRASCRVLDGLGLPLWSSSEVPSCPSYQRVTADECQYVGTYRRSTHSGSISSSGSGSTTDTSDTVTLYRDHFFTADSSRTSETCFQYNCRSLVNRPVTQVGAWSAAGAAGYSLAALRGAGWTFTRSTAACPGT